MNTKQLTPAQIMPKSPIIPVIEIDNIDQSINLAHALIAGGINTMEISLKTDNSFDAIRTLVKEVPMSHIGVGAVLNPTNLVKVRDAGAAFALSPGCSTSLLQRANHINFPLIPTISTGSEIMQGIELGYTNFKLFPAVSLGGVSLLQSFSKSFEQVQFCPTGGINEDNYLDFLSLKNVFSVDGSWVIQSKLIEKDDFDQITQLAKSALSKLSN